MTINEACDLIESYGFYPSLHGTTLYVDRKENGQFLFYIDEISDGKLDGDLLREKLHYAIIENTYGKRF